MGHMTYLIYQQSNNSPPGSKALVLGTTCPCPGEARSLVGEAWRQSSESYKEGAGRVPRKQEEPFSLREGVGCRDSEPPGEVSILSTFL